jgi:cellobiose-specific phosphotransferase system component IIA
MEKRLNTDLLSHLVKFVPLLSNLHLFRIVFGVLLIPDLVNPAASPDINAPVIPIPTSLIMPPNILPAKVVALGQNVEVVVYRRTSRYNRYIHVKSLMTLMVQTIRIAIAMAVLFGITGLIVSNVGPVAFAQETANKQLEEAMKALESGDTGAAEGYLQEANQSLPEGQAKTEVGEAMTALQAGNVTGATTDIETAQAGLQ